MTMKQNTTLPKTEPTSGADPFAEFFVDQDEQLAIRNSSTDPTFAAQARSGPEIRELMVFWVADEQYGIGISELQEIIKVPEITKVPRIGPSILGIFSLRGTIVPLLDLRKVLRLEAAPLTKQARILVVRAGDDWVGLVVDRVISVVRVEADAIDPPPIRTDADVSEMLAGVGRVDDQMVIVLDVKAVVQAMESAA